MTSNSLSNSEDNGPISNRAVDLLKRKYYLSHSLLIADGLIAATACNGVYYEKSARLSFYWLEFIAIS